METKNRRNRTRLACISCHKRKVRCNRRLPCSQCCKVSKAQQCSYLGSEDRELGTFSVSPENVSFGQPLPNTRPDGPELAANFLKQNTSHGDIPGRAYSCPRDLYQSPNRNPSLERRYGASIQGFNNQSQIKSFIQKADSEQRNYLAKSSANYYGRSHYSWVIPMFHEILPHMYRAGFYNDQGKYLEFMKLKMDLRRRLPHELIGINIPHTILDELPAREIVDLCVTRYFETFELIFTVFDFTTFQAQYIAFWELKTNNDLSLITAIVLVVVIGNSSLGVESRISKPTILRWWYWALSWHEIAEETRERDLDTLRIQHLIILTRQLYDFEGSAKSVSSAMLIRNAMSIGLHRDPAMFPNVQSNEYELRRSMWYTILEVDLQCSLDSGIPPTLSPDDWDTLPPANIDDGNSSGISEDSSSRHSSLIKSFELRWKITSVVNRVKFDVEYDEALKLSEALTVCLKSSSSEPSLLNHNETQASKRFQDSLLEIYQRRFLFALHRLFAVQSNIKYCFSYTYCLTQSLLLLQRILPKIENTESYLQNIVQTEGILFSTDLFPAASFLCLALLREDSNKTAGLVTDLPIVREAILDAVKNFIIFAQRMLQVRQRAGKAAILPFIILEYINLVKDPAFDQSLLYEHLQAATNQFAKESFNLFLQRPDLGSDVFRDR